MAYQSLARKYRPKTFSDMVGQDSIAKALGNAIRLGREPHGVIFAGVRGIGKTTSARLYAKALNCQNGPTSEPCNQCESCLAIDQGHHEDVLEIDGASNTGVDDVRALQETLGYVPQRSRFKVYIIDEVHMLSQSAFNALLKTLEEPPEHVVFIFATTELNKVPETILSRCQTFHLKRLSLACIMERLTSIVEREGLASETQALALVAREGRGSMRDALTFLDQVIAVGNGSVRVEALEKLISFSSSQPYLTMMEALCLKDAPTSLKIIEEWDQKGLSFTEVLEELIKFVRHSFVVRDLGHDTIDLLMTGLNPDEISQLDQLGKKVKDFDLNRLFRTLVACRKDLDGSNLDRYIFENYILEWCFDPGLPQLEDLESLWSKKSKTTAGREPSKSGSPSQAKSSPSPSAGTDAKASAQGAQRLGSLKQMFQKSTTSSPAETNSRSQVLSPSSVKRESDQHHAVPNTERAPSRLPESPTSLGRSLPDTRAQKENSSSATQSMTPTATNTEDVWPETWRDLVESWKRKKPLQARILEETYPKTYSRQLIHLEVDSESLAAAKLLNPEIQKKLRQHFESLFEFKGELRLTPLDRAGESSSLKSPASPVGTEKSRETANVDSNPRESILEIKKREKKQAREQLKQDLEFHPITREVLSAFNGRIVRIEYNDGTSESLESDKNGVHESGDPGNSL